MTSQVQKKCIPYIALPIALSSVMVTSAFAAPQINPDAVSVAPGQSVTFNPVENDVGTGIVIERLDRPPFQNGASTGTNSFSGNQITYTAPANYTGTLTFWYGVRDSAGDISSAPVTVTVVEGSTGGGNGGGFVPGAPQVNPDAVSVTSGQSVTFNPLENDVGNGLFIDKLDSPPYQGGSVTGTNSFSGNQITYTAPAGFTGTSTFWYGVKDSAGAISSAPVTVTVTADGGNGGGGGPGGPVASEWPTAGDDAAQTEAGKEIWINPLWNDTQGVYIKEANTWSEKGSQIRVQGNDLVFTPGEYATGKDTFWYVISDAAGRTNAAKVTVTISGASGPTTPYPVANADHYTVNKNSFNNVLRVFDNDSGEGIYFASGNGLYDWSTKGGQTFRGSWDVVYNAPYNFVGTDDFWYTFEDSLGRTNAAKVTVNVVKH